MEGLLQNLPPPPPRRFRVPVRVLIVGLLCLGTFTVTLSRSSISTTMIAMAPQRTSNHSQLLARQDTSPTTSFVRYRRSIASVSSGGRNASKYYHEPICTYESSSLQQAKRKGANISADQLALIEEGDEPPPLKPEFNWTDTQQDYLKGAFAIGYGVALIPCGRLSEQHSGKLVAAIGGVLHTSLNLLTPVAARQSYYLLFALRIVLGVAGAALVPAFFCVIARWIPDAEKSKAIAALSVGNSLGNICLNLLAGFLCQYGIDGGWPSVFYLTGLLNLVWLVLWVLVASNHPAEHHFIGRAELTLIGQRNSIANNHTNLENDEHRRPPPPVSLSLYWHILTSAPVLATIYVKLTHVVFYILLQAKLPQYMVAVLDMSIQQTSMWNTLFHVVLLCTILLTGFLADCAINHGWCLSKTWVRKTFECIACSGISICMVCLAQNQCSRLWFVVEMTVAVAFYGLSTGGSSTIVLDMTTDYAGTLIALMNTVTMLFGCTVPHLVTLLLGGHSDSVSAWQRVFYTAAAFQATGGVAFLLFASARNQGWETLARIEEATQRDQAPSGMCGTTTAATTTQQKQ